MPPSSTVFPATAYRAVALLLILGTGGSLASLSGQGHAHEPPIVLGENAEEAYALAQSSGMFGRFRREDGTVAGSFMQFQVDERLGHLRNVQHGGRLILESIQTNVANMSTTIDGPVAMLGNATTGLTVHDNRYGWMSFDGPVKEVVLRFPGGSDVEAVPEGLTAIVDNRTLRLFYEGGGANNVSMDGTSARIRPQKGHLNFTISLSNGIFGHDTRAGSWSLVAQAGDTAVVDALRPLHATHRILAVNTSQLRLYLEPMPVQDRRDAAHRIETVGTFPPDVRLVVTAPQDLRFQDANATRIFAGERAVGWKNVTAREPFTTILLRQPFGLSGNVTFVHDGQTPRIENLTFLNISKYWRPAEQRPQLSVRTDEPTTLHLRLIDGGAPRLIEIPRVAKQHHIPLDDLEPDTTYSWAVVVRDLAGNTNRTTGTIQTPLDPESLIPEVRILTPNADTHVPAGEVVYVNATVTDGAGAPVADENVTVMLDGEPVEREAKWEGTRLSLRLGILEDGPHEIRVVARGFAPQNIGSDTVEITVGSLHGLPMAPPALFLTLLVALLLVRRRRD